MRKISTFIHKIKLLITALILPFTLSSSAFAYGPERPTYTIQKPADHVTFNSITDNPTIGDERNFVRIYEVGSGQNLGDSVELKPGKIYEVYAAFHNNASSNLNSSGEGIASDVKMRALVPNVVRKNAKPEVSNITVELSWTKQPADERLRTYPPRRFKVWDEAYLTTKEDEIALKYVNDSAIIHATEDKKVLGKLPSLNNRKVDNPVGKEFLVSGEGARIGYTSRSIMPGCAEWSGYVTFLVQASAKPNSTPGKPDEPKPDKEKKVDGKLTKEVSLDGKEYKNEVTAPLDAEVFYRVVFENTGTEKLEKVVFRDKMPPEMEMIKDSLEVKYSDGSVVKDKNFTDHVEFEVAEIKPGEKVEITYRAKVKTLECGKHSYKNQFSIKNDKIERQASATVKAERVCEDEPETPPTPPAPTPNPPKNIPETGPAEIAIASIVILALIGGIVYFVHTKKALKKKMALAGAGQNNAWFGINNRDLGDGGYGKTPTSDASPVSSSDSTQTTSSASTSEPTSVSSVPAPETSSPANQAVDNLVKNALTNLDSADSDPHSTSNFD